MGLDINTVRREKGITLEDLSQRSGVPLSTLKKISAGITTNPNLETVKAIAGALGCSLDDLEPKGIEDGFEKKAPAQVQGLTPEEWGIIQAYRAASQDQAGQALLRGVAAYIGQAAPRIPHRTEEEDIQVVLEDLEAYVHSQGQIREETE